MTPSPCEPPAVDSTAHRRAKMTRESVLAAALELIDGSEVLSMRCLRGALGRDPDVRVPARPQQSRPARRRGGTVLAQLKIDPTDDNWANQPHMVARD
jgi:hypothetical protein